MRLQGVYTDLVTPFSDDGIDEDALTELIERQLAAGVSGIVVASGAAGEEMTLRGGEVGLLLDLSVRVVAGRMSVISGASSNSTAMAVSLAQRAEQAGADAVMITTPWYNRPSQEGVLQHFKRVAESVRCPLILGDAPARTGVNLQIATLARISRLTNVIGIADASGDMARATAVRSACPSWDLLSHHDLSASGGIAHGATGVVSLTANVAPGLVVALHEANLAGQRVLAQRIQVRLFDLQSALNAEPSPAAAKWALAHLGYCRPDTRLPIPTWQDEGVLPTLIRTLALA